MNLNVWNIKDMFSVPPGAGANKSASRSAGQNDHSNLTDSQFLFSSQCLSDSSQSGPMDYNTQSKYQKNVNQCSQDSNPSVYQKYQAKPPLYSCDYKDRGSFQSLGLAKNKSIMEQFEESKKKAKEKHDSEQVNQLLCNIQSTLQDMKITFCHIEESTDVRCRSILDCIDVVSKAFQEKVLTYHESVIKVISAKSDLEQALLDLEKKTLLNDADMTDLKSSVQSLSSGIDVLKLQHSEKHLELSEKIAALSDSMKSSEDKILSEIQKIHLAPEHPLNLIDKSTQTSPTTVQDLSVKRRITSQTSTRSNVGNTRDGISNKENLCTTEPKGTKTRNISSCCVTPDILQTSNNESDNHTMPITNDDSIDDPAVKSANSLQENPPKYTDPQGRKVSKYKTRCLKRQKANKLRQNVKKKRTGLSIKNPTHITTRAVAKKSQYESEDEPVTRQPAHPDKATPESYRSSPSVIPALVRKTRQHKTLEHQPRRYPIEQSTKAAACDRDSVSNARTMHGHRDSPSSCDASDLNCSNMLWFPSSSPLLDYCNINPVQQAPGQKNIHSWFFDSSDDSG